MKHAIIAAGTRHPLWVYWFLLIATLLLASQLPRIHIDTDPENMLLAEQADRVFHNQVETRFDLHDMIVVGAVNNDHPDGIYNVKSLSALHRLSDRILGIEGVIQPDLMSLASVDNITQEGPGTIRFEWMMNRPPETQAEAERIRQMVGRLPLYMDTLVSGDGKASAVYVPIESKDMSYRISREIRDIIADLDSGDEYHITGLPVAEDTFGHDMFLQMGISAPLAALMIFLLMLYFFRNWRLIISPMIVAITTVLCTMGLLIGMGFTVHIMSSMIPIFLMPIAVVDSVHIMSEFADMYRPGRKAKEVMAETVDELYRPMLFTSLTSAAGFASLLLTPIPPVQVFGAFVAFGILLAFVITIVFIPAYVVRMNEDKLASLAAQHDENIEHVDSPLARGLRKFGRFSFGHAKLVVSLALVALIFAVAGIMKIQINDNPTRWFKASHPIRVADRVLNDHFAGTYDAYYVLTAKGEPAVDFRAEAMETLSGLPGSDAISEIREVVESRPDDPNSWFSQVITAIDDALFEVSDPETIAGLEDLMGRAEQAQEASRYFQQPRVLEYIENLQQALEESPLVGKTNALPDVVKVVNRELRSGEDKDYRIPESSRGVSQTLLQFQSSHRPQDLWHMVTTDYRSTTVWLQLGSGDNQDMSAVMRHLDDYLQRHPLPEGMEGRWAGKTYINVVWQDAMVRGMLGSLLGAFVIVFIMMVILFRSALLGIVAMLPLSLTIAVIYGVIGWVGKDYDMPIAVLSALTLGLSIDFAIHFVQRLRALCASTGSFGESVRLMFEEPARAIARNAIVIALGFTPLLLAPLVPYITVGFFMAAIMAISAIVTLALLPAVLGWMSGRMERYCVASKSE
ncbi:MAG: MMPL family transporter [Gammaproteobacteria bacterium]